jgi:hypothetical protein
MWLTYTAFFFVRYEAKLGDGVCTVKVIIGRDRANRWAIKSGKDPNMNIALGIQTLYVVVHAHAYGGYESACGNDAMSTESRATLLEILKIRRQFEER